MSACFVYAFESLWLPASLLKQDAQARLADALFAASRHWEVELHFNKGLAGAPAEAIAAARDTATNPAVLDAFALAIIASGEGHAYPGLPGHEPDLAAARKGGRFSREIDERTAQARPQRRSLCLREQLLRASFGQAYWGANYSKLQAVKEKYDPDGLFFVHNGVGSEPLEPRRLHPID